MLFMYIILPVAILFFFFFFLSIHHRRYHKDVINPINWPIIGMLPYIVHNMSNIHDYATVLLKHHGGTFLFKGPLFTNTNFIITSDFMNVQHITCKNFSNYGKGSNFHEIFEAFGSGIFNADFHEWKQERTLLHSLLKRKSYETFLQQSIQKKLESCLIPFLEEGSSSHQVIDLQDIIDRFTFDCTCTSLFGYDPNTLPNKFTMLLPEVAHEKALQVIEEVMFSRHFTPTWLLKLQKWLQIGQEKRHQVAQENIHKFLQECVTHSKCEEEQGRFNEEESHFGLIRAIIKEGYGKGETCDKYLRDTALNLIAAGNGTISAGLGWFFWLVSTHPVVEAKIIQELRDNCLTQEGECIPLEEFDKLVYLHGAVCESLRLYPPLPFEHKCAIKSDVLPSGDHVSPNTKLLYSLYSMGRMEQIWGEDCMEFKPERWISEKGGIKHVPSYKFIVFNAGPRSCLGKDVSFIQIKMVAIVILCKFQFQALHWVRCLGIPIHGWSREFFDFLVKPFGSLIGLAEDTKNKKRLDVACLRIVTKCKDFINQRVKISINHKIFEISMAEDVARYGSSSFAKIIGDREEDSSEFDSKDEYVEETMVGLMGGSDQEEVHGRDGTAEQEVGDGGKQRLEVASVETPNCDDANFGRKICHINEELIENIAVSKCDGSIIKKDREGYRDDMVEPEDREVARRRSVEATQENSKFEKVNFGNNIRHNNEGIFGNDEAGLCEGPTKIVADTLTSQRLNKEVLKQVGLTRENGPINSDPFNLMEIIEGALAKERGVDSRSKYSELTLAKEGPVLIQGATNGSKPNLDQTKSILGKHGASEPEEQHAESAVAAVQRPYRSAPKLDPSSANALVSQSVLFKKSSRLLVGLNPK